MNRTLLISVALITVASSVASAQKKPLDHSVYDAWQSTAGVTLTDDGSTLLYQITPQEGDAELVISSLESNRQLRIERGGAASVSEDGRWAVFSIKAPFAATRQAKIKKVKADKMPKDSLGIVDLTTLELRKIGPVERFTTALAENNVIAYETGSKDSARLIILNPLSGRADTLRNVGKYTLDRSGRRLAVVFDKNKKDSLSKSGVSLYTLDGMQAQVLSEGKPFYSKPRFNDAGDKLVFLASADSAKTGSKNCGVYLYEQGRGVEELIPAGYSRGMRKGWGVNENADPRFSRLSDRIMLGVGEMIPQNDTTLVDFETAQLDIWNYDIYLTPPAQKARKSQLEKATLDAVINLGSDRHRIVMLGSNVFERISIPDGGQGEWALAVDATPYQIHSTWDSNDLCDLYLVNTLSGERKTVFTALDGSPSLSPAGKYIIWFSNKDLCYHTYEIESGTERDISGRIKGMFYDDEDDHPMVPPQIGRPYWYEDDAAVLLTEKYDLWKVTPDGRNSVCLTDGEGRRRDIQYRYTTVTRNTIHPALRDAGMSQLIKDGQTLYLTAFDRMSKENGWATVSSDKAGLSSSHMVRKSIPTMVKALNADVLAYRQGDFRNPYDVYVSTDGMRSETKMSAINPQQAQYRWGDVQLVHWKAYDGTALDGLLYTPDNLNTSGKYPMMIYFYEKNSETLYNYSSPAPSRSIINIPFYVSRGYVVFVPDIVYQDGHPGESAYNCVCSGAEAMCRQFSFIDKDKMAIQGQSWGGYQTAYLVTRTDMFAAAGAGAPVGNMTSAYGGIRWESGMVRAMQYEHGQSRIGKSLWDEGGLELYIENSPIFHTQGVTTPVLIMHNDNDGAVPWYQGIEFFMALRRFEHPAWLLEYNNEAHNLVERRNCKDLSVRLQQFFDHYLKGDPMPAWMKTGVPITRKGQYFGFETE